MTYPTLTAIDADALTSVQSNLPGDQQKIVAAILADRVSLAAVTETANGNTADLTTLDAQIQAVSTDLQGYKITVAAALNLDQDQLDLLSAAIENLESGDISTLLSNVATAQSDITNLTTELAAANARAEALATSHNSLVAAFNTLTTTLLGEAGAVTATTFA